MAQCSSLSYIIRNVDKNKPSLLVNKGEIDNTSFDLTILGKRRKEYGEVFNENMLHLLENFSCPAEDDGLPLDQQTPDLNIATDTLLSNPTPGQFWHNSSVDRLYYYVDGDPEGSWVPLSLMDDVAGNSGQLNHGEQIPQPVSPITGYVFDYDECSWIVSPAEYSDEIDYMQCYTDLFGNVTMQYRIAGNSTLEDGVVNYQIIGVRGYNTSPQTTAPIPPPSQSSSATPTPTPTPSPSEGADPSPTPTPTPSPSPSPSPSPTPTPTPSSSQGTSYAALELATRSLLGDECTILQTNCVAAHQWIEGTGDGTYTLTGGSGDFSYLWEYVSGDNANIQSPNSASTVISRQASDTTLSGTFRLTVTDNITLDSVNDTFTYQTVHTLPSPTPTPTSTQTPTPSPSPSPSPTPTPTPTPSPSEDNTGDVNPVSVTASGNTQSGACDNEAFASFAFSTSGTFTRNGCCVSACSGNPNASITYDWVVGGSLASGQTAADYAWEVLSVTGDTGVYTGTSTGSSGNMASPPNLRVDGPVGLGDKTVVVDLQISNPNIGSTETLSFTLTILV